MRIAVIGTGVSGLVCARLLSERHDVTVFEAAGYAGGHTNTVAFERGGRRHAVDTGFIVYNDKTYPNFVRLLSLLGVETRPTTMSFSVHCEKSGLEYGTGSARAMLARPSNLARPSFHRMVRDVLRFHREAPALLENDADPDLGEYLRHGGYSDAFVSHYAVPMGAAIWSASPARFLEFPARTFVRFFLNHGLLSVRDQPQWRVVAGGSSRYVDRLVAPLRGRIRLASPVRRVRRKHAVVEIVSDGRAPETFDQVVLATHSDQALRLLDDASAAEKRILGAIAYQRNDVLLHTDTRVLPRSRAAWSAWNYRIPAQAGPVAVTYDMNLLQGLDGPETFCVTLNDDGFVDPSKIVQRLSYDHPVFTREAVAAQACWGEISGRRSTHYAGAYWGYGFHEDGVKSALAVAARFGVGLEDLVPRIDRRAAAAGTEEGQRLAS
jgi:predicted NAD/FAD-binding protein